MKGWTFQDIHVEKLSAPVGWNCTNSKSCIGRPALDAMALPSPAKKDVRDAKKVSSLKLHVAWSMV